MKTQSHPRLHQTVTGLRGISSAERRFVDMMLKGMGNPLLSLQCWDGSRISNHPLVETTPVFLQSRIALWRFLFQPELALKVNAEAKGISLQDAARFRQVMHSAKQHLPAETLMVNSLLGIRRGKTSP